jgi:hypothetical protein
MKTGIIGSGHIGGTLATRFAQVGHEVGMANARGPHTLRDRAKGLGSSVCAMTVEEAERFGEVVVVSIPFGQYHTVPPRQLVGKIVVDTGNYYPGRDGRFPGLDEGRATSSELVQQHLPGARLVKAFNAVRWDTLRDEGKPKGAPDRTAIPLAGDDSEANRVVAGLIDEIGFDPIYVGGLAKGGRRIQPGTPVYVAHLTAAEMTRRLAA